MDLKSMAGIGRATLTKRTILRHSDGSEEQIGDSTTQELTPRPISAAQFKRDRKKKTRRGSLQILGSATKVPYDKSPISSALEGADDSEE